MFKNYFKIAFRNLVRRKGYTAINIGGLAVGIAACLILFLVVNYELSYDKFQAGYKNIYRVVTQDKFSDGITYTPGTAYPVLDAIRVDIPQITSGVLHASYGSQVTVTEKDGANNFSGKKFIEPTGVFFADPQFFSVFHFDWLSGSPALLAEPNNTVLSKNMAEKYFGNWQNAVGQFIKLDNALTLKVAGVLQNVPANSDFPLGIVTSYITFKNSTTYGYSTEWGRTTSDEQVYVRLPQNVSSDNINKLLVQFCSKHYNKKINSEKLHFLQPLSTMHFDNRFGNFGDHVTSTSTLWTLSLIGLFIIIMVCINFINLTTAQAVNRSKEIGVRKVLGSKRSNLFWQMMIETAIIVFASLLLAIALDYVCLPFIKHIDSINEPLSIFTTTTISFLVGIAVIVTIFSGMYPSLIVSGFSPMLALKNKITSATIGGISLRRGLVVAQFAISQVLIIGTIVAISQMNFVQNADLGFSKDAIFVLNSNSDSAVLSRQLAFKQSLLQLPGIQSVSFSSDVPSSDNNWGTNFFFNGVEEKYTLYFKCADEDYFKTFGLQFIAGHGYNHSDTMKDVVINETLVKKLGLKNENDAIGKQIRMGAQDPWRTIVGVLKDFKTNSLREEIRPTLIGPKKRFYSNTSIKIRSANLANTKGAVLKTWDKYYPEYAANNYFMDESINNFYRQEDQLSLLYKIFAGIAIFISCLGLYGLVSFMAVQRTKEIGVRKVLGASVRNIVYLFSKEFTILIAVAFVIAAPVAWFMMNSWLNDFVYRIKLGFEAFVLAIIISIIIAWITVGYKAIKAAIVNPIKSLRTE